MTNRTYTILAFVGIMLPSFALAGFMAALFDPKIQVGEIAGALGSVVGGAIGALGSAAAVYIMLKGQREEEIEKVSAAVLREVAELCKQPIGQLGACAGIHTGQIKSPKSDLARMFHTPEPVIYPAIADRIARLPRPTFIVAFYSQLQETKGVVALIANSPPTDEFITPGHIQQLTDLLISQCQLARFILTNAEPVPCREGLLVAAQRAHMLKVLDEQLVAAKHLFPDAESFQQQAPG